MKLHKLVLLPCLAMAGVASALNVTTQAGGLEAAVSGQTDVTSLTVSGAVNAADFEFIADNMRKLTTLDLSGATVAAYSGAALATGARESLADVVPAYALAGSTVSSVVLPSGLTAIAEGALSSTAITSISIPAGVTSIGSGAFSGCQSLTSVTIPSTVKSLGTHLFAGCGALAKAEVYASVTAVPAAAFAGCSKLAQVTLPSAIQSVDSAAFAGCESLKAISLGRDLRSIGAQAFQGSGLENVDLTGHASLTSIGDWAFADCASLVTVGLPDCVTTVGAGVFFGDEALTSANFPGAATEVAAYTFNGDHALKADGLLHDAVTSIGDYALRGLDQIAEFSLPSDLQWIGDNAMEGWTALEKLTAMTLQVPGTGNDVWYGVAQGDVSLYVPAELYDLYVEAPQWKEFNIVQQTGITEMVNDDPNSGVTAFFDGDLLLIKAPADIATVNLYATSGMLLGTWHPSADQAGIDTSAIQGKVFVVAVTLADNRFVAFKVARR